MTLKDYFRKQFPDDLKGLEFSEPNSVLQSNHELFQIDNNTVYFGGSDWRNIKKDIANVDSNNLEYFFLCLFTITVIDLTMYTYYKDKYDNFRNRTLYPKFGWSGYGPHFENPKKILHVPFLKNIVNYSSSSKHIDEYIDLFIEECDSFFLNYVPDITNKEFMYRLLNDKDFQLKNEDKNTIFENIYLHLKNKII